MSLLDESESNVLDKTTLLGRIFRSLGWKNMSKRAIICACGLARPCVNVECKHSTAVAIRARVASAARIDEARKALEALQDDEWDQAMEPFCRHCGSHQGADCCCKKDD